VEVVLPGFDSVRVRLAEGAGEAMGSEGVRVARAALTEWRVVDDLDGDGRTDALVVGWSSGGGSGTFVELVHFVLRDRRGAPSAWEWQGSLPLGDRVRVRAMTMTDGVVELHLTEHGPDDPMCCPTREAVRSYRVVDGRLLGGDLP
jgi:hypothetical protein